MVDCWLHSSVTALDWEVTGPQDKVTRYSHKLFIYSWKLLVQCYFLKYRLLVCSLELFVTVQILDYSVGFMDAL